MISCRQQIGANRPTAIINGVFQMKIAGRTISDSLTGRGTGLPANGSILELILTLRRISLELWIAYMDLGTSKLFT